MTYEEDLCALAQVIARLQIQADQAGSALRVAEQNHAAERTTWAGLVRERDGARRDLATATDHLAAFRASGAILRAAESSADCVAVHRINVGLLEELEVVLPGSIDRLYGDIAVANERADDESKKSSRLTAENNTLTAKLRDRQSRNGWLTDADLDYVRRVATGDLDLAEVTIDGQNVAVVRIGQVEKLQNKLAEKPTEAMRRLRKELDRAETANLILQEKGKLLVARLERMKKRQSKTRRARK